MAMNMGLAHQVTQVNLLDGNSTRFAVLYSCLPLNATNVPLHYDVHGKRLAANFTARSIKLVDSP